MINCTLCAQALAAGSCVIRSRTETDYKMIKSFFFFPLSQALWYSHFPSTHLLSLLSFSICLQDANSGFKCGSYHFF